MSEIDPGIREVQHRASNDLALVLALLELSASRAEQEETGLVLHEIAGRVRVLLEARRSLQHGERPDLQSLLREICSGLQAMAEPRGVTVTLEISGDRPLPSEGPATAIALAANEVATNCLKHAFPDGGGGKVTITLACPTPDHVCVTVEDDGVPLPDGAQEPPRPGERRGFGLDLAQRLLSAHGGMLIVPENGSKRFEIRRPAGRWLAN